MGVKQINALDVPLLFDGQTDFSGGMVSSLPATALAPNQVADLLNMDNDRNGNLRRRRGFHSIGQLATITQGAQVQGAFFFDTPLIECLLVVAGSTLYRYSGDGNWTMIAEDIVTSATEPVWMAQVGVWLYLSDGLGRCVAFSETDIATGTDGTEIAAGPSSSSVLFAHRYRLFCLNADSADELYVSKFLPTDSDNFDVAGELNKFRVGDGDGDQITAAIPWKGWTILVFKENSIHAVGTQYPSNGDAAETDTSTFTINKISGRVGCRAPRSVAAAGNDVLFLAHDGVRSVARTEADGDGQLSPPLSAPIDDVIERINWPEVSVACGVSWGNRYLLSVPLDGSTEANTTLVFNFKTGAWAVWDGFSVAQWVVTTFNGQTQKLVAVCEDGNAMQYRDDVPATSLTADAFFDVREGSVSDPVYRLTSRGFTFGASDQPKHLRTLEVEFYQSTSDVAVSISVDGKPPDSIDALIPSLSDSTTLPTVLPTILKAQVTTNVSRSLRHVSGNRFTQVVVENPISGGISGDLCVRSINLAGWLKSWGTDHKQTRKTADEGLPLYAGLLDLETTSASDITSLSRFPNQFDARATLHLSADAAGYLWIVVPASFSLAAYPNNFRIGSFNIGMADTLSGGVTINGWTYLELTVDSAAYRAYRSRWRTNACQMTISIAN